VSVDVETEIEIAAPPEVVAAFACDPIARRSGT